MLPSCWIRSLFIVASLAAGAALAAPKAVIEPANVDLGTIRMGETTHGKFTIRNEGDQPLEVTKIQSSCPCVSVEAPKEPIAPGQSLELPLVYDSEDKHGVRGATVAITTNDPVEPIGIVELGINITALVIAEPEKGLDWGLVPRGYDVGKGVILTCGVKDSDMELLDARLERPGLTLKTEKQGPKEGYVRYNIKFAVEPNAPLGNVDNKLIARVKVGDEEAEITLPVVGMVAGDALIGPPLIFSSIYTTKQGDRISEIYVKSSTGGPPPKVLGALCVGPLRATVEPNYAKNQYTINVFAADNLSGGARSGTVYVMSESKDEPIVAVPVHFKAGRPVVVEPEHVIFSLADGVPPAQTVTIASDTGKPFTINEIYFEEDLLSAKIVQATPDANGPARIELVPTGTWDPGRAAGSIVVKTTCVGAEELLIPVLLKQ